MESYGLLIDLVSACKVVFCLKMSVRRVNYFSYKMFHN